MNSKSNKKIDYLQSSKQPIQHSKLDQNFKSQGNYVNHNNAIIDQVQRGHTFSFGHDGLTSGSPIPTSYASL